MATNNVNFKVKNGLDAGGDISTTGVLKSTISAANEGGQIELTSPSSGSSIATNVTIDVYQNKLRFFEAGGSNRGYYLDITSGGSSVGTSLTGGSTGAMNYDQQQATKQSGISASGVTIVSKSFTTNGYPVQVMVTGDAENSTAGGWVKLQLFRDATAIGKIIHVEMSAASENVPYALTVIDTPSAGTYTYALKTVSTVAAGTMNFGETDGPVLTMIELSGPKGDTGSAGASYTLPTATSTTLGGIELFSDTVQSTAANSVTSTASRTYGIQLNSSSQGVVNVPWTDWYPTTFAWTGGTTSGPTGSLTGSGMSAVSYAAIPSASGTASGIVTTGSQTFAGIKTFNNNILLPNGTGLLSITGPSGSTILDSVSIATSGSISSTGGDISTTGGALISSSGVRSDGAFLHTGRTSTTTESVSGMYSSPSGFLSLSRNGTPLIINHYAGSGTVYPVQFYYTGTASGRISMTSGGTPAFASGSDYRMKENIVPITDAIERMKNAKAYTFNKIESADPTMHSQTGFIAHELYEVMPDAVVGEKDAVDENGDPIYQEVMESRLIPIMAQAINDLIAQNEALVARIEALENK